MTNDQIEARAEQVLRDTESFRVPVQIDVVAHRLKLTTNAAALREDVSGMLVVEDDRGAIGDNSTHAPVRQRVTIAHEIAHFVLHLKQNRKSQLFIDRFVFRRDENSSTGNDREEVQANRFGAALLMPASLVRKEIRR